MAEFIFEMLQDIRVDMRKYLKDFEIITLSRLYIDSRPQSLSYYRSSEFVINFDVRQSGVSIPAVLNSNLSYPSINVINLSTC